MQNLWTKNVLGGAISHKIVNCEISQRQIHFSTLQEGNFFCDIALIKKNSKATKKGM